ncbi:MAG: PIN domain-containing protein [Candidatus Diapherotrites archaeon]
MKLVVDTNILITCFWSNSVFKSLSTSQDFEFVSPEYALEEINNHQKEILHKTEITIEEFEKARFDLAVCGVHSTGRIFFFFENSEKFNRIDRKNPS